ncbi:MAG: Rieske 2Fe-2S domain-containing protein [Actinomycetota bacterium]|nr:Rieske 2Fe-2S domain-containing protein [Actinomycetota bacterium]
MRSRTGTSWGNRLHRMMGAVERSPALDRLAGRLDALALRRSQTGGAQPVLTGTWLGHACHPLLTDFADGAWIGASVLDVFGPRGSDPAARRLVGFGVLAAVPTAVTGLAEWRHSEGAARRVGVLHAMTSTAATVLYGCSYLARSRGRLRSGIALGVIGGMVAFVDGYFGGHLSLVRGVGVAHTAFERRPTEWTPALPVEDLRDGQPVPAVVDGTDLVFVRGGGRVFALSARCTYRGAPLDQGRVEEDVIVCPRHGCSYRLEDGAVVRGPASIPQPFLETRVQGGSVEVRAPA